MNNRKFVWLSATALWLTAALAISAVKTGGWSSVQREASWKVHQRLKESSPFQQLVWRNVGPTLVCGRISDIDVHPLEPFTIYVSAGSGGIWKSTNNGTSWMPIFDQEQTFAVGDIAIAPSDPNIIWAGSGEDLMARSSYAGNGVYCSTDRGETWSHMGLADTYHIGRIVIHPLDPRIVYVAAMGHQYTFNQERGLFKTMDGGKTWENVLYIDPKTGVVEVCIDPTNPEILYAAAWERDRKPWNNVESGPGSGLYKTTDGGRSWKRVDGFPAGPHVGRIGLAVAPSNPNVVYALLDNQAPKPESQSGKETTAEGLTILQLEKMTSEQFLSLDKNEVNRFLRSNMLPEEYTAEVIFKMMQAQELTPKSLAQYMLDAWADRKLHVTDVIGGEVYRSDDKGGVWRRVNEQYFQSFFSTYGYSFCDIRVSPDDENQIYVLGIRILSSADGGKTYRYIDGSNVHLDHHAMWIDPVNPDRLILGNDGGINLSWDRGQTWVDLENLPIAEFYAISLDMATPYKIYGGTQDNGSLFGPSDAVPRYWEKDAWKMIGGGDGFFVESDPVDPNTVYFEYQFGNLQRMDLTSSHSRTVMPKSRIGEPAIRMNWMTPYIISKYNHLILYFGANKIYKSLNRGDDWRCISPDLTTNPGPERRGDVTYGTITTLSESPFKPAVLYAGTDDGRIHVTLNDGGSWTDISRNLPDKWVSRVTASRYDEATVYVTLTGYREDDFSTYVYRSTDYGKNWSSLKANLPEEPADVIREDPENPDMLYLGTDLGVYVSINRGRTWHSLCGDLPTCAVHDLAIHPRDRELVIGTHGRSAYVLDVSVLQEMTDAVAEKEIHLFSTKPGRLPYSLEPWYLDTAQHAVIPFYSKSGGPVVLTIHSKQGDVLARIEQEAAKGINFIHWDMNKRPPAEEGPSRFVDPGEYRFLIEGPAVSVEGILEVRNWGE